MIPKEYHFTLDEAERLAITASRRYTIMSFPNDAYAVWDASGSVWVKRADGLILIGER